MTKHTRIDICAPTIGVDQCAVFILRDRVDGEVAPLQVLFKRDIGSRMKSEACISRCGFTLSACECIFFMRLRMQKNRKVFTNCDEAECL